MLIQHAAKRPNFLRRTKSTGPPDLDSPEPDTTTEVTNKFTRRGISKFKPRRESIQKENTEEIAKDSGNSENRRRPSLGGSAVRSERPTRNYVRRRLGGANVTTTPAPSTSSGTVVSRRPFRVASRRRPFTPTSSTTAGTTTTTQSTTDAISEESLQDIGDTDAIEDPLLQEHSAKKSTKIQRRPLLLKEEDQNPSATNDDERKGQNKALASGEDDKKRQSKKYSASFKQNQLDEVLRQKAKSQEEVDVTTEGTTIDDYSAETALAIAAHQLLSAPIPSIPDESKPTKKSTSHTTQQYKYTSPYTEDYTDSKTYSDTKFPEYTSTPFYKSTTVQDYITTGDFISSSIFTPRTSTYVPKSSVFPSTPFTSRISRPTGFTSNLLGVSPSLGPELTSELSRDRTTVSSEFSRSTGFLKGRTNVPGHTGVSQSLRSSTVTPGVSQSLTPSTVRYLGSSEKLIPVPVEDYSLAPEGYSSLGQEPAYFTREYLLESPVTKTYDDEYQYLSPVTTTQTTTRKIPKKTVYRRISTTIPPTEPAYGSTSTVKPRRVPTRKPFEKVPYEKVSKPSANKYKQIENYDYYDDGDEKLAQKYAEGTKVVVHPKGTIECLDIGNFPHPTSCKQFISCARLENGSLLGWEYICPKGLSFDPVGGICNWSAGLGCDEKDH